MAEDIFSLVRTDPDQALAQIDRALVAKQGLRRFIPLAWHTVEGYATYQGNWHLDAIAEHLEAVSRGEMRRLLIGVPPRSTKSLSTAVMWPAWDWTLHPHRRFLFASYAHSLSIRDSTRCRRVISSPWYQGRWGHRFRLTSDQNTKVRFENNHGGYRLSTSVDGTLTGEGADFIVIDDPNNVREAESESVREGTLQWWDEAMSTRLNDPRTGAYVIIQQRVHERDLTGHILAKNHGDWTYLCLPMEYEPDHPHRWFRDPRKEAGELLWPSRVDRKQADELKAALGPYASAAQLQQRPAPREGGIFKRHWFEIVPVAPPDCIWVRGWDLAGTVAKANKADPDWTATCLMGWSRTTKKYYLAEVSRWREDPHEVERIIMSRAQQDGVSTVIRLPQDPGQAGKAQSRYFVTQLAGYHVVSEPETGDKLTRALPLSAQAGVGNVCLVKGNWNDMFLDEITAMPNGAHDDMVDAASGAFRTLTNNTTGIIAFYSRMVDEMRNEPDQERRDADNPSTNAAHAETVDSILSLNA